MKRLSSDDGVTLIELLVTISVIGVVFTAVAAMFLTTLKVNSDARNRLAESQDGQIISAYLADDAQGAKTVTKPTGSVVAFGGTDFDSALAPTTWTVTYALNTATHELSRVKGSTLIVARNVNTAVFDIPSWTLTITEMTGKTLTFNVSTRSN